MQNRFVGYLVTMLPTYHLSRIQDTHTDDETWPCSILHRSCEGQVTKKNFSRRRHQIQNQDITHSTTNAIESLPVFLKLIRICTAVAVPCEVVRLNKTIWRSRVKGEGFQKRPRYLCTESWPSAWREATKSIVGHMLT